MAVPLLRLDDVMAELGIGRTKVHALVWSGELPVVRIGRAVRVRRRDLDSYIEANLSRKGRSTRWGQSPIANVRSCVDNLAYHPQDPL